MLILIRRGVLPQLNFDRYTGPSLGDAAVSYITAVKNDPCSREWISYGLKQGVDSLVARTETYKDEVYIAQHVVTADPPHDYSGPCVLI